MRQAEESNQSTTPSGTTKEHSYIKNCHLIKSLQMCDLVFSRFATHSRMYVKAYLKKR